MDILDQAVVEGADAITDLLDGGLAELLGPEMAARWRNRRERYCPRVVISAPDGTIVAAALTSSRPATAAMKIVDLWCVRDHAVEAVLDAVLALAVRHHAAVVKWELHGRAELPPIAAARGFVPMQPLGMPEAIQPVRGYALWLQPVSHVEARYYAQSTEFTCGAVAALIAAELAGHSGFAGNHTDRRLEIDFWRGASNFPACEPIGLAVALRTRVGTHSVEIALDTEAPLLLEDFEGFERQFRLELQNDSIQHASDLRIPVRKERIEVADIAARISRNEIALLLISQMPMHGENEPHWIMAHASDGHSLVIVQDPWIDRPAGETWVDGHDLPVRLEDLDRMCAWGAEAHRGAVLLSRWTPPT